MSPSPRGELAGAGGGRGKAGGCGPRPRPSVHWKQSEGPRAASVSDPYSRHHYSGHTDICPAFGGMHVSMRIRSEPRKTRIHKWEHTGEGESEGEGGGEGEGEGEGEG